MKVGYKGNDSTITSWEHRPLLLSVGVEMAKKHVAIIHQDFLSDCCTFTCFYNTEASVRIRKSSAHA